ncbi:MAG: protein-arginine deiminase family protein [Planctomycetota bacterium]
MYWVGLIVLISGVGLFWLSFARADGSDRFAKTDVNNRLQLTIETAEKATWPWGGDLIIPVEVDDESGDERARGLRPSVETPANAVLIQVKPPADMPPDVTVRITHEAPRNAVTVYVRDAARWRVLAPGTSFPVDEPRSLAVKATRFAGLDWDGRLTLTATMVSIDGETESATIAMRVAPFVLASSTQHAKQVFIRAYPGRNDAMVDDLKRIAAEAGVAIHIIPGNAPYPAHHIWLQDAVEFGHAWTGRPDAAQVALPSNRNRDIDRFAVSRLVGKGVGVIQVGEYRHEFAAGEGGVSWIDWYGNLEATPPTPKHPFGTAIYGNDPATGAQLNPDVVAFLDAQQAQPTLGLDVGWLQIKHIDELVGFLPANDPAWPYRIVVPDTTVALDLLEQLVADGHGQAPMLSTYEEGITAESLLADNDFVRHNRKLQSDRINPAVARLCEFLGLGQEHVVRLPALFTTSGSARMPNVVNALVINGHVVMSDPDGPDLPNEGGDAFQQRVREILADLPVTVHFVDDQLYHRWSGNVHCATNAIREPLELNPDWFAAPPE